MTLPATTTTPAPPSERPNTAVVRASGQVAVGALALGVAAAGAIAVGAVALGALAVGRLAVGRLALRSGHARRVVIDDLTIVRLRVLDAVRAMPPR
jgi:hypothetical protein